MWGFSSTNLFVFHFLTNFIVLATALGPRKRYIEQTPDLMYPFVHQSFSINLYLILNLGACSSSIIITDSVHPYSYLGIQDTSAMVPR